MPFLRRDDLYLLLVIASLQVVRWVPFLPVADWLALLLSDLAFHLSRAKRAKIDASLKHSFGDAMDAQTRVQVAHASFFAFWDDILSWARPNSSFARNSQLCGLEHLQNALAQGKGAILWESNGWGRRVAAQAILYAHGYDVVQFHAYRHIGGIRAGDNRNSWVFLRIIHRYFDRLERTRVADIVYLPRGSSLAFTRTLAAHLARNSILCVAAEGPNGQKHITLDFLGHSFPFATGMPNLSQLSGAPLLPFFCTCDKAGVYTLEILPPLAPLPDLGRDSAQTILMNYKELLESRVRAHPGWYRHWDGNNFLADNTDT